MLVSQLIQKLRSQSTLYQRYFDRMEEAQVVTHLANILKEAINKNSSDYIRTTLESRGTQPSQNIIKSTVLKKKNDELTIKVTNQTLQPSQHKIYGMPRIHMDNDQDNLNGNPYDYKSSRHIDQIRSRVQIEVSQTNILKSTSKDNHQPSKSQFHPDLKPSIKNEGRNQQAKQKKRSIIEHQNQQNMIKKVKNFVITNSFSVDFIPLAHQSNPNDKNKEIGKIITTKNVNSAKSPQSHQDYLLKEQKEKNAKENNQKLAKLCQQQMKIISHLQLHQRRMELSDEMPKVEPSPISNTKKIFKKHTKKAIDLDCSCCSSNESQLFQKILRDKHNSQSNLYKSNMKTYKINDNPLYQISSSEETPRYQLY